MDPLVVIGIVSLLVLAGGGLVVAARRAGPASEEPDPRFVAGVAIVGAGTALTAAVGVVGFTLILAGTLLMALSIIRTRHHH